MNDLALIILGGAFLAFQCIGSWCVVKSMLKDMRRLRQRAKPMYDLPVVAIVKMMVRGQRSLFVILLDIRATIFTRMVL